MKTYKLYINALYTVVGGYVDQDIEIEAFGYQQFELLDNQMLNLNDIVSVQANNPLEAYAIVKDRFSTTRHIGYHSIYDDNAFDYLSVQYQAVHIQFDDKRDEEYENILEELNSEYDNLIA